MNDLIPFWAWSWLLTAIGITGLLLAGSKRKVGWAIGLAAQVPWIVYALATEQYGFIVSALAYGATYARNWWRWYREQHPGFQVTLFTSYPHQAPGWEGHPRATAEGTGPVTLHQEFEHEGITMVVTDAEFQQGEPVRWYALDKASWVQRNRVRD